MHNFIFSANIRPVRAQVIQLVNNGQKSSQ
jgi:hypothetical protein